MARTLPLASVLLLVACAAPTPADPAPPSDDADGGAATGALSQRWGHPAPTPRRFHPDGARYVTSSPRARFEVDAHGMHAESLGADLSVHLEAVGRRASTVPIAPVAAHAMQPGVLELRHPNIDERWSTTEQGLEHSFRIHQPPPEVGPVSLEVAFEGLRPVEDGVDIVLVDARGQARARYAGLAVEDATGARLPAHFEVVDERTVCIVFDDRGATYPVYVDPLVTMRVLEFQLDGDAQTGQLGEHVASSGDGTRVVVSAPGLRRTDSRGGGLFVLRNDAGDWVIEDVILRYGAGLFPNDIDMSGDGARIVAGFESLRRAAVFVRTGTTWSEEQLLFGPSSSGFGAGVAINDAGDRMAFGAPRSAGSVLVYERDSLNNWSEAQRVTVSGTAGLGASVDFNGAGDRLVAGESAGGPAVGSAFVFDRSAGGTWSMTSELVAPVRAAGDQGGWAVSMSADGRTVAVGASGAHERGHGHGAVDVFALSGTWSHMARLDPAPGTEHARLGTSVALDGTGQRLVSGAPGEARPGEPLGAVYVFARSGGSWTTEGRLHPTTADSPSPAFGSSVAINDAGNALVVGAPNERGLSGISGNAFVFVRSFSTWSETLRLRDRLDDAGAAFEDRLGEAIALDDTGTRALTGIPGADRPPRTNVGAASVFRRDGASWTVEQELPLPTNFQNTDYGTTLALSGDGTRAFVGAPGHTVMGRGDAGHVFAWVRSGTTWSVEETFQAAMVNHDMRFGSALATDRNGTRVVIGARRTPPLRQGAAWVFVRSGGAWMLEQRLPVPEPDDVGQFGAAVTMSHAGDRIAVGAPAHSSGVGRIYLYVRSGDRWTLEQQLSPPAGPPLGFGGVLATDAEGATLLAGAPLADSNDGLAYVFNRTGSTWVRAETLRDPTPGDHARYGTSVSIDRSGFRAVLGGTNDMSQAGSVAVFGRAPSGWTHVANVVDEPREQDSLFGAAVAFAGTGDYFAVGVPGADTLIEDTGKVVVFSAAGELGVPCGEAAGCQSGFCADGVCCESACGAGDCVACAEVRTGMPDGTCAPALAGTSCGDASDSGCSAPDTCDGAGACQPNHLADGTACTGASFCTSGDVCMTGACIEGDAPTCDPRTQKCDEENDACFARCGDGVVDSGESCDEGSSNSELPDATCRTDCASAGCGDGVVDTGEACDSGEANSEAPDAACRLNCMSAGCGDGVVDSSEQCDAGDANSDSEPGACRTSCLLASCGDGVVDPGEGCDEGADNGPDGRCRTNCAPATCGDGVVDPGEACDDGSDNADTPGASCRTTCVRPSCGDGIVDDTEQCDEGPANSDTAPDACRRDCRAASCGDGIVDTGEMCDEGGASATCTDRCLPPGVDGGPRVDAGVTDGGPEPGGDGGCGCRAAASGRSGFGWLALGLAVLLRRRRKPAW